MKVESEKKNMKVQNIFFDIKVLQKEIFWKGNICITQSPLK